MDEGKDEEEEGGGGEEVSTEEEEEATMVYAATIPAAITLENLEVPDVADVETFTDFVDVLQTGILASLDVTGDANVKIISVGGVAVPDLNRRLSGLVVEFEIIIKVTDEEGGDTANAVRDNLVTAAIDNLVAAVEEGSVTTEIVAAATEKGGDSTTVFESVTVDKTAFVAPEKDDVVEEVTEVDEEVLQDLDGAASGIKGTGSAVLLATVMAAALL